jgi:translation elongation factor EF-1alpha
MAEKPIGEVTNYFKQVKAAAVKLTAPLQIGEKIKITGGEKSFEMTVDSMQIDREEIVKAKKGDEVGLLVPEDVHKGYKVFKIEPAK